MSNEQQSAAPESQPKQGCCAAREALEEIYRNGCSNCDPVAIAREALAAPCECDMLKAEIERLKTQLGAIAIETLKYNIDCPEIYHLCYMALVDMTLPAEEQSEIMRSMMEKAQKEKSK